MASNIFDGYHYVGRRTLELIAPQDRVSLKIPISDEFDAIHIGWMAFKTDTTGLKTIAFKFKNLDDANKEVIQDVAGEQYHEASLVTYLDTRPDALIYYENAYPPIPISRRGTYTTLDYEIYINVAPNHAGITVSNPVFVSITFLKKK